MTKTSGADAGRTPREVLDLYHRAMREMAADDLADLYAEDGTHEFPFTTPGFPGRFEGREAVRAGYRAAWGASPLRMVEIADVVVHEAAEAGTLVGEHVAVVESARGERFAVPGLLVVRVRHGLIARMRDYMDALAVGRAGASIASKSPAAAS
ncbi:nuclear transport factor 2 family protein [Streptomyces sp. NPDC059783]|uniref:nuclear transport factor 2 family protein n=1 Tax=Streptomyces sp. NPDC059783 TaxID=3346944 RepID=UPI0036566D0A